MKLSIGDRWINHVLTHAPANNDRFVESVGFIIGFGQLLLFLLNVFTGDSDIQLLTLAAFSLLVAMSQFERRKLVTIIRTKNQELQKLQAQLPAEEGIRYTLRFFFDYSSGTCLWSANEITSTRFGYPVEIAQLPISAKLKARIDQLVTSYDTSIDWENPAGPSLWNKAQWQQFDKEALMAFELLQEELQGNFTIINEYA